MSNSPTTPISSLPPKVRSKLLKLKADKLDIDDQIASLTAVKDNLSRDLLALSLEHNLGKIESGDTCSTCNGSGRILLGKGVPAQPCSSCSGTGLVNRWRLREPTYSTRVSISKERLLEHGVDIKVIVDSTVETRSKQFVVLERIKEKKNNGKNDKEKGK